MKHDLLVTLFYNLARNGDQDWVYKADLDEADGWQLVTDSHTPDSTPAIKHRQGKGEGRERHTEQKSLQKSRGSNTFFIYKVLNVCFHSLIFLKSETVCLCCLCLLVHSNSHQSMLTIAKLLIAFKIDISSIYVFFNLCSLLSTSI